MFACLNYINFRSSGKGITFSFFGTLPEGNGNWEIMSMIFPGSEYGVEIYAKAVKNEMSD